METPIRFGQPTKKTKNPQEITLDLGQSYMMAGFTYWPIQNRYPFGIITHYEVMVSNDNKNWKTAAKGEFGNVVNNRIEQKVNFDLISGRYIKLRALKIHGDDTRASFAEIGVITSN